MTKAKSESAYASNVERPNCVKCGAIMWLARVSPDSPGHDRNSFECPGCNNEESVVVKAKGDRAWGQLRK
jgi:hypothetical protein